MINYARYGALETPSLFGSLFGSPAWSQHREKKRRPFRCGPEFRTRGLRNRVRARARNCAPHALRIIYCTIEI
jgi:hypothetical protein